VQITTIDDHGRQQHPSTAVNADLAACVTPHNASARNRQASRAVFDQVAGVNSIVFTESARTGRLDAPASRSERTRAFETPFPSWHCNTTERWSHPPQLNHCKPRRRLTWTTNAGNWTMNVQPFQFRSTSSHGGIPCGDDCPPARTGVFATSPHGGHDARCGTHHRQRRRRSGGTVTW